MSCNTRGMTANADFDAWFALFRNVVREQREALASVPDDQRATVVGRGAGGDPTLEIDRSLERILLDALAKAPEEVSVVTEEAGLIGSADTVLLVDPLDGSYNAQRQFPAYAFSVALARGPHLRSVEFGYVFDLSLGDEFAACRGQGAWCNGTPVPLRSRGATEAVAFESVEYDPGLLAAVIEAATARLGNFRSRIVGSTALALCYAAIGRVDAVISCGECRVIDFAAAQLIAREAGLAVGCLGRDIGSIGFGLGREHRISGAPTSRHLSLVGASVGEALTSRRSP